jgi:hypothetical protein
MRILLSVLMLAASIQIAQADETSSAPPGGSEGPSCVINADGTSACE